MATTENFAALGSLPEDKKHRKNRKKRKMKQAPCVPLDGTISEQNLDAGHKNFSSYDQNHQTEQNTGNQALEESEMHDSIQEGALFKSVHTQFDDITVSEDINIEQDTLNDRPKGGKKLRLKKRKLDIENDISGSGKGGLSSERCPVNNSNHHRGTEILTSDNAVTATFKHEMLGTSSPLSENDNLNMIAGGITTPISVNSCVKMDIIENIGDDNVVTSSEVAVGDRIQDPKISMKKKRKKKKNKKKKKMSSMSQFELEEAGAMTRPSSANDMTSTQSNEGNCVATGEGITISHNHFDKISESNHCVKEVNVHKIMESACSCVDQQTPMDGLKNESMSTLDWSELVARELNAVKSYKLSNVNVEDFQVDQSLTCMHSGFAGQGTSLVKDSSKISTISEDICDQNLTTVQEDIIDIPYVVSTKRTQNEVLLNTEATFLEHKKGVQLSSLDPAENICCIIAVSDAVHDCVLHPSPERNCTGCPRRKLLILDINGLLADIVAPVRSGYKPDIMVSQKAVFRRPFCESFLQFCFERFDVAVWSSRVKKNVDKVLDFLMGGLKNKLVFYWDRSHCTITGFPTVENREKPLVLKELKKLWEKHQSHFSWEKEKYNRSNTLLLDDSPYKALRNPADTAIFPLSYQYTDVNDCSLGPGGDLRVYLEKLAMADNIPDYVRNHPFGQRPIRDTNLSWKYYKKVLCALNPSDGY